MTPKDIHSLITVGESETLEFKSSFNVQVIETLVAFANTRGGKVLVGVSDDGSLIGLSINSESVQNWINEIKIKTSPSLIPEIYITEVDGVTVIIFSIQEYPIKPVSFRGKYFKRVVNSNHILKTEEVVNMHLQTFNTSWDYHINNQFNVNHISFEKVQLSIDTMNQLGSRITDDPLTFLIKHDLVRDGLVTNAAFLLFKKEESVLTTIELGRFQSDTIIKDSARTKEDILRQIEQVLSFIKKHINKEVIITGDAQNTQKWQYPLEAIREIVTNMIVHRDYRSSSDSIVKIFNDKIEFYNPGRLPDSITVEDLLSNNYKSTPRNKLIADFCKSLGLIEKYGSGIKRIIEYCIADQHTIPEFKNISDGFLVTVFAKNSDKVTDKVTDHDTDHDTDRLKEVLDAIKKNNRITVAQIAASNGVSKSTVLRDLHKLKAQKKIKRIGKEKNGYWEVSVQS
ncbi:MAG: putative DNA binding domain-containing protein [Cyclobacteriaceae bacterium]|nr:putative DNA binding domain-containing protein [Cyclobacteriaceae bacterium]